MKLQQRLSTLQQRLSTLQQRVCAAALSQRSRLLPLALGFLLAALVFGPDWGGQRGEASGDDPHAHGEAPASDTTWTCSMHPQIRKDEPGQCPICGMDLIPAGEAGDAELGPAQIILSKRAQALARLRTTPVVRHADAAGTLRLLGRIEHDEESLRSVTAWTGGRIERLHVNVTGQKVTAGQVIATLYSPEVFAAHQDLIVAKKQVAQLADAAESSRRAAQAALEAARQRLRLIGVPDGELARMERQESPTRSVAIRTPFGGTVIERLATQGAYVSTGTPLYQISDLSTLWVQLDAYETDLPLLTEGQAVRVTVEALPGELYEGAITFIDPTLDPQRRTSQVRVEVDNEEGRLRPGMFATARVDAQRTEQIAPLVIPETAPLFTGRRAVVYVEVSGGPRALYEARTVRLGPKLNGFYPVVAGLSEGQRVVSRGAFALDADLQIRGGESMMTRADDTDASSWDQAIAVRPEDRAELAPVVDAYLDLQRALAEDQLDEAHGATARLMKASDAVTIESPEAAREAWERIVLEVEAHGRQVSHARDLEQARAGFEGVSRAVELLLGVFGNPTDKELNLAFCPMAQGSDGATWVQEGEAIDNSYFGASMRDCGEIRQAVGPGGYLADSESEAATAGSGAPSGGHAH